MALIRQSPTALGFVRKRRAQVEAELDFTYNLHPLSSSRLANHLRYRSILGSLLHGSYSPISIALQAHFLDMSAKKRGTQLSVSAGKEEQKGVIIGSR